jgi:hypothetical protein
MAAAAAASNAKKGLLFWKEGNAGAAAAAAAAATGAAQLPAANWRKYLPGGSAASAFSPIITSWLKLLFYGVSAIFALFILLTIVHFTVYPVFSFMPGDGGYINIPFFSDAQKMAAGAANPPETALGISGAPSSGYSIAFDLTIPADFTNLQTPRVLLYRAAAPIGTGGTAPSGSATTLKGYEAYLRDIYTGTNIVAWLDPTLNDLYLSAILTGDTAAAPKRVHTSNPIKNLPTNKKTRIAIVFTDVFAEVYVNGYLRQTLTYKPAQGALLEMDGQKKFYTAPTISGSAVASPQIMNVSFWPRPLAAGEAMGGA